MEEDGGYFGYAVDMMKALCRQAGLTPEFSMLSSAEGFARIREGRVQVIPGIIQTEYTAGFLDFSERIIQLQMGIFAGADRADIENWESLEDMTIASYRGYEFASAVQEYVPGVRVVLADSAEGMFRLVAAGMAGMARHGVGPS